MDQIRQLRFEDFRDEKFEQGYQEVLERSWGPNTENEMHHHEFTADRIVIQGEFWLTTASSLTLSSENNHLKVDTCQLNV